MINRNIREPKQKRSIEKKNKIIRAGFELLCEKGYHNTNTAQIAKRAGVSTGIIYNYFIDKRDIFIAVWDYFATNMSNAIFSELQTLPTDFDLEETITKIIDNIVLAHLSTPKAQEEFSAMSYQDSDIAEYIINYEENLIEMLTQVLASHGYHFTHPHEKLHIVYDMVENYCHEYLYHKHSCIDYTIMKAIVTKTIVDILK